MNMHENFVSSQELLAAAPAPSRSTRFDRWRHALRLWLTRCAENYAAAAAYDELSRLSDRELNRRALSRDILARDLTPRREDTTKKF